jgi:hypothetical protein
MKRFFFIATMAIMAIGCQKTEVQNEVFKPIGFNTEVGKQTRAIVTGEDYLDPQNPQPFAVYAYGWHDGTENVLPVMDNVEIGYTPESGTGENLTPAKWGATGNIKYYWPNDPKTSLNFYAFSPYIQRPDVAATTEVDEESAPATKADIPHQVMTVTSLSHNETDGLVFTGYEHSNMYVDFMVATPVLGATYTNQGGVAYQGEEKVPVVFNHEMTQIIFNVKTAETFTGIQFTVKEITLSGIGNVANYSNANLIKTEKTNDGVWNVPTFTSGTWGTPTSYTGVYKIFPQTAYGVNALNGCPVANFTTQEDTEVSVANPLVTMGVTMIPQQINDNQQFTIVYEIAGTGVAEEKVTRVVRFNDIAANATQVHWGNNKCITYNVILGLKEIQFEPTVAKWEPTPGNDYSFAQ